MLENSGSRHEADFSSLLELFVILVEAQAGQKVSTEDAWLNDRQVLAIKLYRHLYSMRQLSSGSTLFAQNLEHAFIDHSSIQVLARAALETYLVFYYVFALDDLVESKFRHLTWKLGGLMDRQKLTPITEAARTTKRTELSQVIELQTQIASQNFFSSFTEKQQKKILEGEWRIGKGWEQLATNAGFHTTYFRNIYTYLCGYSHSSYASALQIREAKELSSQRELSNSMFGVACMIAAHFAFTYSNLFSRAKDALDASPDLKSIARKWQFGANDMKHIYESPSETT